MTEKRIKAPEWFLQVNDDSMKAMAQFTKMTGISMHWVKECSDKAFHEAMRKVAASDRKQALMAVRYANSVNDYKWARVRYENMADPAFAKADKLTFDEDTREIIATTGLLENFLKAIGGLKEMFEETFGGKKNERKEI